MCIRPELGVCWKACGTRENENTRRRHVYCLRAKARRKLINERKEVYVGTDTLLCRARENVGVVQASIITTPSTKRVFKYNDATPRAAQMPSAAAAKSAVVAWRGTVTRPVARGAIKHVKLGRVVGEEALSCR